MTYAQEQRLRLIDFLVHHYGKVSRRPIMDYFGIAEACATRDFALYVKMAPDNIVFDQRAKVYIKGVNFKRVYP